MTTTRAILNYASTRGGSFQRQELLLDVVRHNLDINQRTIDLQLSRLIASNVILRTGRGNYKLMEKKQPFFTYQPSEEEKTIYQKLKLQFPFSEMCVWSPKVLSSFMLHIPNVNYILVDVEKDGIEPVFNALQQLQPKRQILMTPTSKDCDRYLIGTDAIVVRQLIGESPITQSDGCTVPCIEKILVDAISDNELRFANSSEIYNIFANVRERFNVNISKLMRYASRRNRKEKVKQILQIIENDKPKK